MILHINTGEETIQKRINHTYNTKTKYKIANKELDKNKGKVDSWTIEWELPHEGINIK